MYVFAEPYEEHEIDAIQNGEYFQALKLAEARVRSEREAKAADALSESQENEDRQPETSEHVERTRAEAGTAEKPQSAEMAAVEEPQSADNMEQNESSTSNEPETDSDHSQKENWEVDSTTSENSTLDAPSADTVPWESPQLETTTALDTSASETQATIPIPKPLPSDPSNESHETKSSSTEDLDDDVLESEARKLPPRDLLAMVLKVQNYINGFQITAPPNPGPEDKWEISYTLERYSDHRAARLYQMCSERRRKAHDDEFREQIMNDNTPTDKEETADKTGPGDKVAAGKTRAKDWNQGFLAHLRELSLRGKKWRNEFNEMFAWKEKVVWKECTPPSNFGQMEWKGNNKTS
jgi:hypothetical protein